MTSLRTRRIFAALHSFYNSARVWKEQLQPARSPPRLPVRLAPSAPHTLSLERKQSKQHRHLLYRPENQLSRRNLSTHLPAGRTVARGNRQTRTRRILHLPILSARHKPARRPLFTACRGFFSASIHLSVRGMVGNGKTASKATVAEARARLAAGRGELRSERGSAAVMRHTHTRAEFLLCFSAAAAAAVWQRHPTNPRLGSESQFIPPPDFAALLSGPDTRIRRNLGRDVQTPIRYHIY